MNFIKSVKKFFSIKIYVWIMLLVLVIGLGGFVSGYNKYLANKSEVQVNESVSYLEKVNEVVFLNVGIQKIIQSSNANEVFGLEIPWSKKTALISLNYKAKFGIKKPVNITKKKENSYVVTVPKFEVIGVDLDRKNPYTQYDIKGEVLSYSTKNVDTGKLVTKGLSTKSQKKYLKTYEQYLRESATNYYNDIFKAINKENKVKVIFQ